MRRNKLLYEGEVYSKSYMEELLKKDLFETEKVQNKRQRSEEEVEVVNSTQRQKQDSTQANKSSEYISDSGIAKDGKITNFFARGATPKTRHFSQ